MASSPMSHLIEGLRTALSTGAVLSGPEALDARDTAQARSFGAQLGTPAAVLRPISTAEVSIILKAANGERHPVVPWGGCTGLVDGTYAEGALVLSLERMNAIEDVDEPNRVMRVQAGCTLQAACDAAVEQELLLPLDLGARGSATIGGIISTNAGGNRVLRWGMMREMVLGLEVVLADGTVVSTLNSLIKNNAGYDVKQLFIGSEGTLGVITRAVLRLRPLPISQNVALLAVDAFDHIPLALRRFERDLGGTLSSFEVMWPEFYELVTSAPARGRAVVPYGHSFYLLVEAQGATPATDEDRFESVLSEALEAGEIATAAIAKSDAERNAIWGLRDDVAQLNRLGPFIPFDVSLKITDMPEYVAQVRRTLEGRWGTTCRLVVFGHLGDGNLHLIAGLGTEAPDARHVVEEIVYGLLPEGHRSSISAEHGIGLQKRDYLHHSRSATEIALMRTLKRSLDPYNVLNPGKVLPKQA
jgi:FAD/FMN-containing dehydrogenase